MRAAWALSTASPRASRRVRSARARASRAPSSRPSSRPWVRWTLSAVSMTRLRPASSARDGVVGQHAVDQGRDGDADEEAPVVEHGVAGERRPGARGVVPLEHRAVVDADVEEPSYAAHREGAGLGRDVPGPLAVAHLEGDLFELSSPRGGVGRGGEDAHVGRGVGVLLRAGEHVDRGEVSRREAATKHVGHLGVGEGVRRIGPHRLDDDTVNHLTVCLGLHQPLVEGRECVVTARRPGRAAGRARGEEGVGRALRGHRGAV